MLLKRELFLNISWQSGTSGLKIIIWVTHSKFYNIACFTILKDILLVIFQKTKASGINKKLDAAIFSVIRKLGTIKSTALE